MSRNMASPPARSLFGHPKHAWSKLLGLAAEIQARIRRCRTFGCRDLKVCPRADQEKQGGRGNVSSETSRLPPRFVPFQCAIESPAKPARLRRCVRHCLRMFQLHDRRPREENAMFRPSFLNLQQPAKIAPILRLNDRASPKFQRSAPIQKTQIPHRTPTQNRRPDLLTTSHWPLTAPLSAVFHKSFPEISVKKRRIDCEFCLTKPP